jgi:hypothetical protein
MSRFRKQYRALTDAEREHVEQIKDAAERLEELIDHGNLRTNTPRADQRMLHLALANLEQAVMWATKAYT